MELTFEKYNELEYLYGTPFYLMYPDTFRKNIENFKRAFTIRNMDIILGYSFKTNFTPPY